MKSTGIVRKVDELGRIVIPREIRNKFEIAEKEFLPNKLLLRGSPDVFLLILCYYFKNDEYETNYIPFYPFCRFRISGKGH